MFILFILLMPQLAYNEQNNGYIESKLEKVPKICLNETYHPKPFKRKPDREWVKAIITLAKTCELAPHQVESIIRVESNYCKYTVSKSSTALGCMQVLRKTASDDYHKLVDDWYSLKIGVKVLCNFKKKYPKTFMWRYHIGTSKNLSIQQQKDVAIYIKKTNPKLNKFFKE